MKKKLYKTRAAIGRALQSLAERSSLLQKPFYGTAGRFFESATPCPDARNLPLTN
jgi:hypothetical protein